MKISKHLKLKVLGYKTIRRIPSTLELEQAQRLDEKDYYKERLKALVILENIEAAKRAMSYER